MIIEIFRPASTGNIPSVSDSVPGGHISPATDSLHGGQKSKQKKDKPPTQTVDSVPAKPLGSKW